MVNTWSRKFVTGQWFAIRYAVQDRFVASSVTHSTASHHRGKRFLGFNLFSQNLCYELLDWQT